MKATDHASVTVKSLLNIQEGKERGPSGPVEKNVVSIYSTLSNLETRRKVTTQETIITYKECAVLS